MICLLDRAHRAELRSSLYKTREETQKRADEIICFKCNKKIITEIVAQVNPEYEEGNGFIIKHKGWYNDNNFSHYACLVIEEKMNRYIKSDFDNLIVSEDMKVFIDYLISWNFDTKGALVTAPCGTGKTHALVSFFKKLELITPSVMFVTLQDLLSAIRSEMLENKEYMLDKALKSKILIIDDFGVEKQTEWVIDTFYKIINERYNNNLPVFISTNLNVKEIKDYFGERVLSRLYGMCNFFTFKGKDFRREVK